MNPLAGLAMILAAAKLGGTRQSHEAEALYLLQKFRFGVQRFRDSKRCNDKQYDLYNAIETYGMLIAHSEEAIDRDNTVAQGWARQAYEELKSMKKEFDDLC